MGREVRRGPRYSASRENRDDSSSPAAPRSVDIVMTNYSYHLPALREAQIRETGRMVHRRGRTRMLVGSAVVAGVVVLAALGLWSFQRSFIYFPDTSRPPSADEVLPGGQDVRFTTSDGLELSAWYVPAPEADADTVLVASGNGGNRADRAELGRSIVDSGRGALLLDYRGYGGNPGSPSEEGMAKDVRAAREFLLGDEVSAERLIYLGESIGAAVVTELAAEHPPAGLLLRSPFSSLADAGRAAYGVPVGWVLRDTFPVVEHMARVDAPVAVIYGDADSIVPPEQSRAVAQASRDAGNETYELSVTAAEHNDARLAHGPEITEALTLLTQR